MKSYIQIIKPGIIVSNLIATIGGFYFSNPIKIDYNLLFFLLLGVGTIIASGCILNNIIDINIDRKMYRTKKRILVQYPEYIFFYKILSIFIFFISVLIFLLKVNFLSCILSVFAFFNYVFLYSAFFKRKSQYSIFVGSISGSLPALIGYCSVTNNIDLKSILLFLIYFIWQFPHSYSILIFYEKDYKRANIPTIVQQNGKLYTIKTIILYILLFSFFTYMLYIYQFIKKKYFYVLFILDMIWYTISLLYYLLNKKYYARLLFFHSLVIILIFNIILIIN